MRNRSLKKGFIYHIFTKSIAGYKIFRSNKDYQRFIETLKFYQYRGLPIRFSAYIDIKNKEKFFRKHLLNKDQIVDILAYCLMPTHIHLILCQLTEQGISDYMRVVLDSYSRYFNLKNSRKGPLWQGRFKSTIVESDEQLLHLTRYIHLNPATDRLVRRPEEWSYSSYLEYLGKSINKLCNYSRYLDIIPEEYQAFVNSQIDYQRGLKTCTYEVQVF
jgi:putative transposase